MGKTWKKILGFAILTAQCTALYLMYPKFFEAMFMGFLAAAVVIGFIMLIFYAVHLIEGKQ